MPGGVQLAASGQYRGGPVGGIAMAGLIPAAERVVGAEGVLWSLPMRADSVVVGTLNFYRLSGAVLAEPIDAVQVLADVVAAMLVTDPAAGSQYAVADRWPGGLWSIRRSGY